MPSKKATKTRKPRTTRDENKAAQDAQSPRTMRQQAPVNISFDLFKKKMNESRYGDEPQVDWISANDIANVFFVHRTFAFKSKFGGDQIGYDITLMEPDGERFLMSLSANEERNAFHDAMIDMKKSHGRNIYVGPFAIERVPSATAGHKPYIKLVSIEDTDDDLI